MSNFGKIIKGIGGFYYVKTPDGIVETRARGKFRKDSLMPYVGDNVKVSDGFVMEIMPRKNMFVRPPIANIDKLIIVAASMNPAPDFLYIDKMLVTAAANNVETALCFNKCDLTSECEKFAEIYKNAGYKVFVTSTVDNLGIEQLKEYMKNSVTALCGFSGVGKSSLINAITQTYAFEVGEISSRLNRGKHTTRHVELVEYDDNSYFADTPGFSMLALSKDIEADKLIQYFPDLKRFSDNCKFADCSHISSKFCSVCDAVLRGDISASRYENYVTLYNLQKENKEWK